MSKKHSMELINLLLDEIQKNINITLENKNK